MVLIWIDSKSWNIKVWLCVFVRQLVAETNATKLQKNILFRLKAWFSAKKQKAKNRHCNGLHSTYLIMLLRLYKHACEIRDSNFEIFFQLPILLWILFLSWKTHLHMYVQINLQLRWSKSTLSTELETPFNRRLNGFTNAIC